MRTYREMTEGYPFWVKVRYTPFIIKEIIKGKYNKIKKYIREKFYSVYEKAWDKFDLKISHALLEYKKYKYISKITEGYNGKHLNSIITLLSNTMNNVISDLASRGVSIRNSVLVGHIYKLVLPYYILKDMDILDCLGVQAMSGPVSTVSTLKYEKVKDNEGKISLYSTTNEALTRRLDTGIAVEAIMDAKSVHGIDILDEINEILSLELRNELESELFNIILSSSDTLDMVDKKDSSLDYSIHKTANIIAKETRRGVGNIVLVSREICYKLLGSVKGFNNVTFEGTISGNIRVYSVPVRLSDDEKLIIVGYSAFPLEDIPSGIDSAIIYTPYIPVFYMGVVMDPITFEPVRRMATRGNTVVRDNVGNYYKRLLT